MSAGTIASRRVFRLGAAAPVRLLMAWAIALGLTGAVTGCSGCDPAAEGEGQRGAGGLDGLSPGSCTPVCGDGEICRRDRCTVPCAGDEDCPFGERCTADEYCYPEVSGGDTVACEADAECDSRVCHEGSCIAPRACLNTAECFQDEICSLDGSCVPACTADTDCPQGEHCVNGGCMAGAECEGDEDCSEGPCADGACVESCTDDAECGRDTGCGEDGFCEPRCAFHDECPGGFCVHGECLAELPSDVDDPTIEPGDVEDPAEQEDPEDRVPECTTNEDCEDPTARCEDGTCIGFDICESDEECAEGTYCQRGQCRPFCEGDEECPGDQACDDGRCDTAPDDVACRSTDQCEPCESCIFGVCTVSEYFCRDDDDCGIDKLCENGFCTYECVDPEDCPRGQSCIDGVCLDDPPPVSECVFNEACDEGFICINGRCHTPCEVHSECGFRQMCDHGVCQPDRRPGLECTRSAHCSVAMSECVDGHCALTCFEDDECVTGACEVGFCTR